jgi:hypothetical protein
MRKASCEGRRLRYRKVLRVHSPNARRVLHIRDYDSRNAPLPQRCTGPARNGCSSFRNGLIHRKLAMARWVPFVTLHKILRYRLVTMLYRPVCLSSPRWIFDKPKKHFNVDGQLFRWAKKKFALRYWVEMRRFPIKSRIGCEIDLRTGRYQYCRLKLLLLGGIEALYAAVLDEARNRTLSVCCRFQEGRHKNLVCIS